MKNDKIWAVLLHLGYNMWTELPIKDGVKCFDCRTGIQCATDYLRCQKDVWTRVTDNLVGTGCNTIVIDVGEAIVFDSHPEIAVKGSWSKKEAADEIARLKGMGFNVIPKLNFSASHDEWMGPYCRMVSSPQYYKFCADLIDETCELFGNPNLFHIGMDEECLSVQEHMNMCVIRHGELYWHDVNFFVDNVEKHGARAWMWADYCWHSPTSKQSFWDHASKEILMSNWHYGHFCEDGWVRNCYSAYRELEEHGYDQVPTGGCHRYDDNLEMTVEHSLKNIADERLKGFMITTWKPTMKEYEEEMLRAGRILGDVHAKYVTEA